MQVITSIGWREYCTCGVSRAIEQHANVRDWHRNNLMLRYHDSEGCPECHPAPLQTPHTAECDDNYEASIDR